MEPELENTNDEITELGRLNQVTSVSKYLALGLFIILPFLGGWIGYSYAPTKEVLVESIVMVNKPQPTTSVSGSSLGKSIELNELQNLFSLSTKATGTELFYSQKLGVGFTYNPSVSLDTEKPNSKVVVEESENLISVYVQELGASSAQTIEVFKKDPNISIKETIKNEFLSESMPEDCYVNTLDNENTESNYVLLSISWPKSADANDPWANLAKCPGKYSEYNGFSQFIFNPSVPDKYIFINMGQGGFSDDGSLDNKDKQDWSRSILIQ